MKKDKSYLDKLNFDPKPEVESELTPLRAQELAVSNELLKTISLPEKSLKSPRKKRSEIPSE